MNEDTQNSDAAAITPDNIGARIAAIEQKLKPDALAKAIDQSMLSITNLRAFLQILSLIFTIFLAGIGLLSWFGFSNLDEIRKRSAEVEVTHRSMQGLYTSAQEIQMSAATVISNIQTQTQDGLQAVKQKQAEALASLGSDIASAQENIHAQQKSIQEQQRTTELTSSQLASTIEEMSKQTTRLRAMEEELKAVMSSSTSESFFSAPTNRAYLFQKKDGATAVVLRLEKPPLPQTLSGTYNNYAFSPGTLNVLHKNFVFTVISAGKDTVKDMRMVIGYAPDPNGEAETNSVVIKENGIELNGQLYVLE